MGRYTRRKPKPPSVQLSFTDSHSPSLTGVLTRAKTLALQKSANSATGGAAGSYIQLRSRRLVKPISKQKETRVSPNPSNARIANSSVLKVESVNSVGSGENLVGKEDELLTTVKDCGSFGIGDEKEKEKEEEEGSFGDNMLEEIEGRGRTTRETTPCSLIRDPDTIRIPGSSTKSTIRTETKSLQNTTPRHVTLTEMEEFFTGPEEQQQRLFIEKYNFDPVTDKPLPGRYEWVKLDP